jgi:hypothetical protein
MTAVALAALLRAAAPAADAQPEAPSLRLRYHDVRTDAAGMILPWSDEEPPAPSTACSVWGFWQRLCDCARRRHEAHGRLLDRDRLHGDPPHAARDAREDHVRQGQ